MKGENWLRLLGLSGIFFGMTAYVDAADLPDVWECFKRVDAVGQIGTVIEKLDSANYPGAAHEAGILRSFSASPEGNLLDTIYRRLLNRASPVRADDLRPLMFLLSPSERAIFAYRRWSDAGLIERTAMLYLLARNLEDPQVRWQLEWTANPKERNGFCGIYRDPDSRALAQRLLGH